jgi:hypothetical protein
VSFVGFSKNSLNLSLVVPPGAGIYRNESKVVVGTSKGNFYTFNWGEFGYHNDAFSGPLSPISMMIPITERIAVTAGEEGELH